jgi:hypothetical protein
MKISVKVGDETLLKVEGDFNHGETELMFEYVIHPDSTFTHPFDSRTLEGSLAGWSPLVASATSCFRALSMADDTNPFIADLQRYGATRLPQLLQELAGPPPIEQAEVDMLIKVLSLDPRRLPDILSKVVGLIDEMLPGFFDIEKSLGSFNWLGNGGSTKLPFGIKTSAPSHEACLITDRSDGRPIFGVLSNTAILGNDEVPSAESVIRSLCLTGGCGESLRVINRAFATHVTSAVSRSVLEQAYWAILYPAVDIVTRIATACTVAVGACLIYSAPSGASALELGVALAMPGAALVGLNLIRRLANEILTGGVYSPQAVVEGALHRLSTDGSQTLSVIGSTLLEHIDAHSAAHTSLSLAPPPIEHWQQLFAAKSTPDPCVSRQPHNITLSSDVYLSTDELQRVEMELRQHGLDDILASRDNIHAADVNSKLLHGLVMSTWFAHKHGRAVPVGRDCSLSFLLRSANHQACNSDGERDELRIAFQRVLHSLKLTPEDWSFAARPLWMSYMIEKQAMHRRAQQIAASALRAAIS